MVNKPTFTIMTKDEEFDNFEYICYCLFVLSIFIKLVAQKVCKISYSILSNSN